MKATIDAAGRIVVPKPLRQALGLKPGQPLEIRAGDGRLEIEIAPTPIQLKKRGKGLVAVPDADLLALTAEQVRDSRWLLLLRPPPMAIIEVQRVDYKRECRIRVNALSFCGT